MRRSRSYPMPTGPLPVDTVALPDGRGRIVVVADTHSQPNPSMVDRLVELRPAAILHAGDIGNPTVLDGLAEFAPVIAVRGNIDGHALPDARIVEVDSVAGRLRLLLTHVAVYGPRLRSEVAAAATAAGASLVVCGHSHVPFLGADKGLIVFNPGSIGPKRFSLPILFGTLEFGPEGVRPAHHEVATGAEWLPPG